MALARLAQAEKGAGPLTKEEEVGTWFSNPAADSSRPGTGGVGKYLANKQASNPGNKTGQQDDGSVPPPAKKAKQAAYGNFDAW